MTGAMLCFLISQLWWAAYSLNEKNTSNAAGWLFLVLAGFLSAAK